MKEEDLPRIFQYIGGIVNSLSGYAYMIGGRPDHVHILTSFPVTVTVADFIRTIKSNTTRWLKEKDAMWYHGFSWQEGYGVFSVSESNKLTVANYISQQKEHHRKLSLEEEFLQFLKKHNLSSTRNRV